MDVRCPQCGELIPLDDVNVAKDVALCRRCAQTFALSDVADADVAAYGRFDPTDPPPGAWYVESGWETRVGATTRSATAWFLVPFMCVWSGFSLGGIYGRQIASGKFSLGTSLFGIPFLLGTVFLGGIALMFLAGKVEVVLREGVGEVFVGLAKLGWRRRFDIADVTGVEENWSSTRWGRNDESGRQIVLAGRRRIQFGSMLNDERRVFVLRALRALLRKPAGGRR